jgi:hypothetical protein
MRCKNIDYTYTDDFTYEFNEVMVEIENDNNIVLNIKYLVDGDGLVGALILYCSKSEVRDINIDKLLKDL